MRLWSRAAALLLLAAGACLAIGCSDDGTGPDNKPAPAPGKHIWSMRFGDENFQYARCLAVDASGNVFIAGNFSGTIDFGDGPLTASGSLWDIFVAKFGPDGSHIWSKRFGDDRQQFVQSIAVDPSGNAIITGSFQGTIDFGGGTLDSGSPTMEDAFIAKFGPGGAHLWSKKFGNTGNTQAGAGVTADAWGNVFLAGSFEGTINLGGSTLTSAGDADAFVAKFTPGGVHRWSKRFGSTNNQYPSDIAADASGSIFVVGRFVDGIDFGGGTLASGPLFIAKLDSTSAHVWSDGYGGSGDSQMSEVAVDASGNAFVTGYFSGTTDFGGGTLTSAGDGDIFTAKFGPGGAHVWSKRYGDAAQQNGTAIAVDVSGNTFVMGYFYGTVDFGGGALTDAGAGDVFIAKLGPGGDHLWSKRFGDAQYQIAFGLGTNASGNVFAAGGFDGTVAFGGNTLTSAGDLDIFVAKLGP
jgi:hypothetical protein